MHSPAFTMYHVVKSLFTDNSFSKEIWVLTCQFPVLNTADVRLMDKEGETVLHWACKSEKENDGMVKFVLDK